MNCIKNVHQKISTETQLMEQELNGSQNSIKTNESQQSPEIIDNENELLVSIDDEPAASLANLAPLSSISEVTLDKYPTS